MSFQRSILVLGFLLIGTGLGGRPVAAESPGGRGRDTRTSASPAGIEAAAPRSQVEVAWFGAESAPSSRATAARRAALASGIEDAGAPARALIAPAGDDPVLSEALLAVKLSPRLPLAHMALASVHWQDGERGAALRSLLSAVAAVPRNLEASLWLASAVLAVFSIVLVVGSLAFIAMVGSSVFPRAAHDLGDLATRRMPAFARAALLGSVVLAPLALGEGVLGLSIVLLAIGATYGGARNRMALALAATLLVLGLFPIARLAGRSIEALAADPVAESALAVRQGIPTRGDIELLEAVADHDLLAMRALAAHARQRGALDEALERYTALAEQVPGDPAVVTNLANLLFRAGEVDEAIALYQRATRSIDSPVLWFNLSQAYARTFQMEPFETALGRAQQLGDGIVAELSQVGDPAFVADLPLPIEPIRSRMLAASHGGAFAIALRTPVAPGRLGKDWMATAGLLAMALVVATALGTRFELAGSCTRCGVRVCARCDGAVWDSQTCDNCRRLFHHPESTDPVLRAARLDQLRGRGARIERAARIGSILVPGLGGVLVGRPDLAFLCMLLFGGAAASLALRDGVVPDPLVLGATGPLLMTTMAAAAGLAYAVLVLASLAIRRNQ